MQRAINSCMRSYTDKLKYTMYTYFTYGLMYKDTLLRGKVNSNRNEGLTVSACALIASSCAPYFWGKGGQGALMLC